MRLFSLFVFSCLIGCGAFALKSAAAPSSLSDVEAMVIENACRHLVLDYAHYRDTNNGDAYAALFADDAILDVSAFRNNAAVRGRGEIRKAFDGQGVIPWRRHILTNIRIEILDADHAQGISYVSVYGGGRPPAPTDKAPLLGAPTVVGEYHDVFVRTESGWRFSERRFRPVLTSMAPPAKAQ